MVFRKRPATKKFVPRRNYKRKAFRKAVSTIAKRAVRSSAETKYIDYTANANVTQVQSALVYSLTNGISVGTADNGNRIGDKVTARSLDLRYTLSPIASYSGVEDFVRVLVVKIMSPSWYSSFYQDILQSPANGLASIPAPFNHDNRRKFHIIYDRVHKFDVNGSNSTFVRKLINLKNSTIGYSASGTTAIVNDLKLVIYGSGLLASGTCHYEYHNARLNYIDL